MKTFLISVQDVKDNSYLDNNIDDKTIKTALINCQEQMIEPVIGSKLYDYLIAGINNGNLPLAYQNLVVQKMWDPIIHGTLYMVARNLLFRLTNSSIVSDSNQNSTAIGRTDMETMRYEYQNSFQHHITKLQLYLNANAGAFPEYGQADSDDLPASGSQQGINFYYDGDIII